MKLFDIFFWLTGVLALVMIVYGTLCFKFSVATLGVYLIGVTVGYAMHKSLIKTLK